MLTLILSLALVGQDDYVAGYRPKPGDKLVLAGPSGTKVYVAMTLFRVADVEKAVKAKDDASLERMVARGDAASLPAEAPVVYLKNHPGKAADDDLSEVRIADGPLKDKVVICRTAAVKLIDPAKVEARKKAELAARAKADAKPKRAALDEDQVAEDVRAAIKKAKAETARLPLLEQKKQKEKMMKAAIETVCKKHKASLSEINAIATRARIFVNFDGASYDVAGKRVK